MGFNSERHDYPDLHKKQEAVPVQVPSVGNTKASKLCVGFSKFATRHSAQTGKFRKPNA